MTTGQLQPWGSRGHVPPRRVSVQTPASLVQFWVLLAGSRGGQKLCLWRETDFLCPCWVFCTDLTLLTDPQSKASL